MNQNKILTAPGNEAAWGSFTFTPNGHIPSSIQTRVYLLPHCLIHIAPVTDVKYAENSFARSKSHQVHKYGMLLIIIHLPDGVYPCSAARMQNRLLHAFCRQDMIFGELPEQPPPSARNRFRILIRRPASVRICKMRRVALPHSFHIKLPPLTENNIKRQGAGLITYKEGSASSSNFLMTA